MKVLTIELNPSEIRLLKRCANSQVRTPENLARYFIVRGLGLIDESEQVLENSKPIIAENVVTGSNNGFVGSQP